MIQAYIDYMKKPINDEGKTPKYAILPLIKYLKAHGNVIKFMRNAFENNKVAVPTIWCPFDDENSNFVIVFKQLGGNVIASDIKNGKDFFNYEPDVTYDYIISNPPFSLKNQILERLIKLTKGKYIKGIMLLPLNVLESVKRFAFGKTETPHLLIFDRRINFSGTKASSFATIYVSNGFFPNQLNFERLLK